MYHENIRRVARKEGEFDALVEAVHTLLDIPREQSVTQGIIQCAQTLCRPVLMVYREALGNFSAGRTNRA